ncbi:GMC family oxidoreductase N-terminal domain-containing protein [Nocardia cyriacigeorgica]
MVARREIVLSAGTVGSAQLLLRSGIGPGAPPPPPPVL